MRKSEAKYRREFEAQAELFWESIAREFQSREIEAAELAAQAVNRGWTLELQAAAQELGDIRRENGESSYPVSIEEATRYLYRGRLANA
jgi:hypothetical protein